MAPHHAAGNPGSVRGVEDGVEAVLRRCRDRHEDLACPRARDGTSRLVQAPDDADAENAAASDAWVVVEEADYPGLVTLPQLAREAATGATRRRL